jgi:hypothetical protein
MRIVTNPILKNVLFYYKRLYWLGRFDTSDRINPSRLSAERRFILHVRVGSVVKGIKAIFTPINITFIMSYGFLIGLAVRI